MNCDSHEALWLTSSSRETSVRTVADSHQLQSLQICGNILVKVTLSLEISSPIAEHDVEWNQVISAQCGSPFWAVLGLSAAFG